MKHPTRCRVARITQPVATIIPAPIVKDIILPVAYFRNKLLSTLAISLAADLDIFPNSPPYIFNCGYTRSFLAISSLRLLNARSGVDPISSPNFATSDVVIGTSLPEIFTISAKLASRIIFDTEPTDSSPNSINPAAFFATGILVIASCSGASSERNERNTDSESATVDRLIPFRSSRNAAKAIFNNLKYYQKCNNDN
uniref:ORF2 n=1 Tax=Kallithea virus TaxID=1654582 RepID=A0A0F7KNI3_9VIRU|nr:ORF2 [Kallithea virus]